MGALRSFALAALLPVCACAQTGFSHPLSPDVGAVTCSQVEAPPAFLAGAWTGAVRADEGWTGNALSEAAFGAAGLCSVQESTAMVLNPEPGASLEVDSSTLIAWDGLSKRWKLLSTDSRGYTHLAIGGPEADGRWVFEVVTADASPASRRIVYSEITAESYRWAWQGRADAAAVWADRLVITFQRADD